MAEKILPKAIEIQRSIIKKYRKAIWNPFIGAVKEYELIKEGDKIAVCISGGKDSMLLAKCMQQLCAHSEVNFTLRFVTMDPGYRADNRALIEENAKKMDIPLEIYESDIFDVANNAGGSPCYLCARMRRGWLYNKAKVHKLFLSTTLFDIKSAQSAEFLVIKARIRPFSLNGTTFLYHYH